jgi:hypothetical protein
MSLWKRRLRITSTSIVGHMTEVRDLETGGIVPGVAQIRIDIRAQHMTTAHLLCYKQDDSGRFAIKDGEPVTETRTIQDVSVDILAMEPLKRAEIVQMFKDALFEEAAHHKQYYLWRLADALGLHLDFGGDGIPEKGVIP